MSIWIRFIGLVARSVVRCGVHALYYFALEYGETKPMPQSMESHAVLQSVSELQLGHGHGHEQGQGKRANG